MQSKRLAAAGVHVTVGVGGGAAGADAAGAVHLILRQKKEQMHEMVEACAGVQKMHRYPLWSMRALTPSLTLPCLRVTWSWC